MIKNVLRTPLIITIAIGIATLTAQGASASDGSITFDGTIGSSTCTVASSSPTEVTLPLIQVASLGAAGLVAGKTPFSIILAGCTASVPANISTYFEPSSTNIGIDGNLLNTNTGASAATGVEVRLLNSASTVIDLTKPSGSQNSTSVANPGGAVTLNYYAEYYASAAATAGSVKTVATYSLIYN